MLTREALKRKPSAFNLENRDGLEHKLLISMKQGIYIYIISVFW